MSPTTLVISLCFLRVPESSDHLRDIFVTLWLTNILKHTDPLSRGNRKLEQLTVWTSFAPSRLGFNNLGIAGLLLFSRDYHSVLGSGRLLPNTKCKCQKRIQILQKKSPEMNEHKQCGDTRKRDHLRCAQCDYDHQALTTYMDCREVVRPQRDSTCNLDEQSPNTSLCSSPKTNELLHNLSIPSQFTFDKRNSWEKKACSERGVSPHSHDTDNQSMIVETESRQLTHASRIETATPSRGT